MQLAMYLGIIRRWLWLMGLGIVAGALIGYVAAGRSVPTYRASATIWITATAVPGVYTSATDLVSYATMYAPLVLSNDVLQRALTDIGDSSSPDAIRGEVSALPDARSSIITVEVADPNPGRAEALANSIAEAFTTTTPNPATKQSIISTATSATPSTNPRARQISTALGALVGLIAAVGASFLLDASSDRVQSPRDLEETLGVRFLGSLPPIGPRKKGQIDPIFDPASKEADRYRRVRPGILRALGPLPTSVLVVTPSASVDRGAIIVNLAATFAETGLRVAIVDADPQSPWLAPALGLRERVGLIDLVQRTNVPLQQAILGLRTPGVTAVPSGIPGATPATVLSSPRISAVIHEIQQTADIVLIGCAPETRRSDATVLAEHLGQAILVIDAVSERRELALRCAEDIERAGATVAGAIVTNAAASYFQESVAGAREVVASAAQPINSSSTNGVLHQLPATSNNHYDADRHDVKAERAVVRKH